jgi:hypothetical protein
VEHGEAQGLLQLRLSIELDVSSLPVAIEGLALGLGQAVEALGEAALQAGVHLITEPVHALLRGPVVGEQLHQPQRPPGLELRRQRDPPEVRLGLGQGRDIAVVLQHVVHPGGHDQPRALRLVAEHHAQPVVHGQQRAQRVAERLAATGIVSSGRVRPVRLEVGLDRDPDRPVHGLHLVVDGHEAPQ